MGKDLKPMIEVLDPTGFASKPMGFILNREFWDRDDFQITKPMCYKIKDTHLPSADGACRPSNILLEIYQQNNQSLPEVKAFTSERR